MYYLIVYIPDKTWKSIVECIYYTRIGYRVDKTSFFFFSFLPIYNKIISFDDFFLFFLFIYLLRRSLIELRFQLLFQNLKKKKRMCEERIWKISYLKSLLTILPQVLFLSLMKTLNEVVSSCVALKYRVNWKSFNITRSISVNTFVCIVTLQCWTIEKVIPCWAR